MSRPMLYADSADVDAIRPLLTAGLLRGVTTNPTILRAQGFTLEESTRLYGAWREQGAEEIFFQTVGDTAAAIIASGEQISALGGCATVKIPATEEGFSAAAQLVRAGVPVLMTAIYSTAQAVLAASIGARYIAPYLGRLNDAGRDGIAVIAEMNQVIAGSDTSVLAASVRSREAVASLVLVGVHHITAAPKVISECLRDEASDAAARVFESDAQIR